MIAKGVAEYVENAVIKKLQALKDLSQLQEWSKYEIAKEVFVEYLNAGTDWTDFDNRLQKKLWYKYEIFKDEAAEKEWSKEVEEIMSRFVVSDSPNWRWVYPYEIKQDDYKMIKEVVNEVLAG
jgi:hypothetical protein